MNFRRHESYRYSGVSWFGEVPSHWTFPKLKSLAAFTGGGTPSRERAEFWNGEIPWVSPKDMKSESISGAEEQITGLGLSSSASNLVPAGSVLIVIRSGILKHTIPVAQNVIPVALNQDMKALVFGRDCLASYFTRWVQGLNKELLFAWLKQGATVESLEHANIADTIVPLPPLSEQAAIAAFLDRETTKIDALVKAQQQLMALLGEEVSAAALPALDRSLEASLGSVVSVADRPVQLVSGETYTALGLFNRGRGLFHKEPRVAEDMGDSDFQWVEEGDLIISGQFAWEGAIALAGQDEAGCIVSHRYYLLRGVPARARTEFIFALLCSSYGNFLMGENSRGAAGRNRPLNLKALLKEKMPIADLPAQEHVSRAVRSRRLIMAEASRQIELLTEYRTALISAAVTGRIDVRGYRAADVRKAVSAEIIHLNFRNRTFGRVKNQKLLYLAETHAGIHEIAGCYLREAAGPYDSGLMAVVERELVGDGVLTVNQPGGIGGVVSYQITPDSRPDRERLKAMLGDRLAALEHVNAKLADLDTRGVEAVATLYAVWNDGLLDGEACDDARVIHGFLDEWHPEKREKFKAADLHPWLDWIRRNGLVPQGRGPRTATGRLFV